MIYELFIAYWTVRILGELFLGEEEEEKHRIIKCRCDICSGIVILN